MTVIWLQGREALYKYGHENDSYVIRSGVIFIWFTATKLLEYYIDLMVKLLYRLFLFLNFLFYFLLNITSSY